MEGGPVLILFAHPALQKSRTQVHLVEAVRGLPNVTVHDLYEEYPDFHVDVVREQELVVAHQTIVFQHPFYWYSSPALLKQWQDLVLEYEWAYGPGGEALVGKNAISAISSGGSAHAYRPEGHNRFTMAELLRPFEQTATLCGMRWLPPFVVHGVGRLKRSQITETYAPAYKRLVIALRDGEIDHKSLETTDYANPLAGVDTGL